MDNQAAPTGLPRRRRKVLASVFGYLVFALILALALIRMLTKHHSAHGDPSVSPLSIQNLISWWEYDRPILVGIGVLASIALIGFLLPPKR